MKASTRIYKRLIRALVPARILGWADFIFRGREMKNRWGGPLNGQEGRLAVVRDLFKLISFAAVVETGTFRGSSTGFFHKCGHCPVWSVEKEPRYAAFSRLRYRKTKAISIHCGDSREFLKKLRAEEFFPSGAPVFFYLDAHWGKDLPLLVELDLIQSHWPEAVVMVDDFRVPDDEGYKYDNYGQGASLDLALIAQCQGEHPACFFPVLHSSEETGSRTGSVVLTWNSKLVGLLASCPTLRRWSR